MLTPIDIQNHTLKTSVSGYNKKDTEEFLASILDSYETLFKENRTLKEKITSLSEGIQYYKQMENTLQKALILAEKTSTETQEAANAQADSVIKDAKAQADAAIEDAKAQADAAIKDAKAQADNIKAGAEAAVKESEKRAAGIIKDAEIQAGQVIREAEEKAAGIRSDAQAELDGIRISSIKLVQDYEKYCGQVRKLATAQLELLESETYKLRVRELDIDNTDNRNCNGGINQQDAESTGIAGNTDTVEGTDTVVNIKDTENTGGKETEEFSWNNNGSGGSGTEEPETPFTFIDPE